MKAGKKIQRALDERVKGFDSLMARIPVANRNAYTRPGSRSKKSR